MCAAEIYSGKSLLKFWCTYKT